MLSVYLKYPVLLFIFMGIWPLKIKNKFLAILLQRCLYGCGLFFTITLTASMFLELPNCYHIGMKNMVSNISIGFQFLIGIVKCWVIQLPTFRHVIQRTLITEKNILEGKNEDIKKTLIMHAKTSNKLHIAILFSVVFNAILFTISPFVMKMSDPESEWRLPVDSWLPFNLNEHYINSFIWNIWGGVYITSYINSSNMAYFSMMIFSASQLEILKSEIRNGINNTNFNDNEVHQNLRKIIIYYKNIRKFVTDLNGVMKFLNLFTFLFCITHTAMVGFEIVTEELSFQLLKNIWYFLCTTTPEVAVNYWFGNEIYLQNSEVTDVIWESDWYNCNLSNKKTILILMMQVQRPLRLEVGYSQYLSLETMLMIIKRSFSYMVTLKQFFMMKSTET